MRKLALLTFALLLGAVPHQQETFESMARAALSPIEGTSALAGLRANVEVIRDSAGVPHIYASNVDDLFFAQGYVIAQDRLWQMDMYRRTYSGELAEIMGPDYVEHDRLMRLVQYRGPMDEREFGVYHPEGRRIFDAFAAGVNAYIADAGDRLPVEFRLTGLRPGQWTPRASILRAQTALPLGDARSELRLARQVAELGAAEANRRANPSPYRDLVVPQGFDPSMVTEEAADALNGLRTAPPRPALLPEYQRMKDALPSENRGAQEDSPGSNNWAVSGELMASGKVLVANDPHRNVSNPAIRYIVHLNAPGWDIIGATEAPLPGVAIGHTGTIAWGLTIVGTDQSDVYVERVNPANHNEVMFRGQWQPLRIEYDTILVKGAAPVVVAQKFSRHGPIFHEDTLRHVAYALRSTMHEPGGAGYLGALRYHALDNCMEFVDAQQYYHAPTENMVCGDTHGNIAWHASALAPRRPNWHGRLPVPGTGEYEWDGFRDDHPQEINPARGWIATANHDIHPDGYDPPLFFSNGPARTRFDRLTDLFTSGSNFTMADMRRFQMDSYSAAAHETARLYDGWATSDPALEPLRIMLADWDGYRTRNSAAAALQYHVDRALDDDHSSAALEAALVEGRDALIRQQGDLQSQWRWGRIHRSELPHSFVSAYDIPAVERDGGSGTVAATGATFREIIDFANLDGSLVTNAPGQSAQPGSPFYSNLTDTWGRGEYFRLVYTRPAVERMARFRMSLTPAR
ncbi:penicillin acylase family protein [soil metagenome]